MQELSDVCIKLRSKLHDTLSDTLDGEKKVVRSKLRDKGWTQEEINSYTLYMYHSDDYIRRRNLGFLTEVEAEEKEEEEGGQAT